MADESAELDRVWIEAWIRSIGTVAKRNQKNPVAAVGSEISRAGAGGA